MALTSSSPTATIATIGILALVLGAFIAYQFEAGPLRDARSAYLQAKSTEQGKERDVQALTDAQAALTEKEAELASLGVTKDTLAAVIPATEDMPGLYLQMEAAVQGASGLTDVSYQVGTPNQDSGQVEVPVSVSATGSYADIRSLMVTLEDATRPLTFTSVSLAPPTADGAQGYAFTGTAYVRARSISPAYAAAATTN